MSTQHTLLLRLAGPMQSWGHRSRFDDRDTGLEPTRSGVIGLICSAMGLPRDTVLSRFERLRMGARMDRPGRVQVDYHTAQNVIKANGGGRDTVVSFRHYLADACFLVGLETDDLSLLTSIAAALADPVWPLYLGRKSFPLTLPPLLPGGSIRESTSLEDALRNAPIHPVAIVGRKDRDGRLRLLIEPPLGTAGEIVQSDVPLSFAARRFGLRTQTHLEPVPLGSVPIEEDPCFSHA